jgi:hypothetical protein
MKGAPRRAARPACGVATHRRDWRGAGTGRIEPDGACALRGSGIRSL